MTGPVVLMGAMKGEISAFRNALSAAVVTKWKGFTFYEGNLKGRSAVVIKSGVGKVLSSLVTQHVIEKYKPSCIIFSGIAGSISSKLEIGDIVAGKDSVQHDMDARHFKYPRGQIPYTGFRFVSSDPGLFEKTLKCKSLTGKIIGGRILSGDQFIADSQSESRKYLIEELEGDCIDMEGAAVALVCSINEVPHLLLRTISDKADGNTKINLKEFLKKSSENSLNIILQILKGL